MNKGIIKCLKNSIGEKGNYCYSLPVETTKAVIKELNRLNNIIDELEEIINYEIQEWKDTDDELMKARVQEDKHILEVIEELKENNK